MGRLIAAVYDWSTQASEMACLRQWRTELLRQLVGHVLEVGAGTGLNIPYYPPTVAPLVLSEPDPHVRRRLSQRARAEHGQQAQILDASLEGLSLPNDSFDAVVGTLVLCSVPRLDRALAEIFRVRKPGGRFVFLEHVAAEDRPRRLRWQHRLEPFWRAVSGNCHLARRTDDAIIAAGFRIVDFKRESVRKAWLRRYGPACLSLGTPRHSFFLLFKIPAPPAWRICVSQPSAFPYETRLNVLFPALEVVDLQPLVEACTFSWYNQTLCRVNDSVVRLGVMQGEYHWHKHEHDDEFFYVVEGQFMVDLEDRSVTLAPRQGFVVPRGVVHRTRAPVRTVVLMIETAAIIPTGN